MSDMSWNSKHCAQFQKLYLLYLFSVSLNDEQD